MSGSSVWFTVDEPTEVVDAAGVAVGRLRPGNRYRAVEVTVDRVFVAGPGGTRASIDRAAARPSPAGPSGADGPSQGSGASARRGITPWAMIGAVLLLLGGGAVAWLVAGDDDRRVADPIDATLDSGEGSSEPVENEGPVLNVAFEADAAVNVPVGEDRVWTLLGDVSGFGPHRLVQVDPTTAEVVHEVAIDGFIPSTARATPVEVDANGTWLVSVPAGSNGASDGVVRLERLDPATAEVIGGVDLEQGGSALAAVAGEGSIWLADGGTSVHRVDSSTTGPEGAVDLGAELDVIEVGPTALWAVSGEAEKAFRIDTGSPATRTPAGGDNGADEVSLPGLGVPGAAQVAVGHGALWVAGAGAVPEVVRIDAADLEVLGVEVPALEQPTDDDPEAAPLDLSATEQLVIGLARNEVLAFAPDTGRIAWRQQVPGVWPERTLGPFTRERAREQANAVERDGVVWVPADTAIVGLAAEDGTVVERIELSDSPAFGLLATDGGLIAAAGSTLYELTM